MMAQLATLPFCRTSGPVFSNHCGTPATLRRFVSIRKPPPSPGQTASTWLPNRYIRRPDGTLCEPPNSRLGVGELEAPAGRTEWLGRSYTEGGRRGHYVEVPWRAPRARSAVLGGKSAVFDA